MAAAATITATSLEALVNYCGREPSIQQSTLPNNMSSTSSQSLPVSVSVRYTLEQTSGSSDSETSFLWNDSNVGEARMGLHEGQEPLQPAAGDHTYSGVHDHGNLPSLHQGGPMTLLIACVQQAKLTNDEYLTAKMNEVNPHVDKKVKVDQPGP